MSVGSACTPRFRSVEGIAAFAFGAGGPLVSPDVSRVRGAFLTGRVFLGPGTFVAAVVTVFAAAAVPVCTVRTVRVVVAGAVLVFAAGGIGAFSAGAGARACFFRGGDGGESGMGSYPAIFSVGLRWRFAPAGRTSSVSPLEPVRILALARVTRGIGDGDALVALTDRERDMDGRGVPTESNKAGQGSDRQTATNVWRCTRIYPD